MTAEPAAAAPVDDRRLAELGAVLRLDQRLLQATGWLDAIGLPSVVLKGPAVAHLDHADPSDRTYGDVDLLVRSHDLGAVAAVLADRGYVRRQPPLRPSVDRHLTKSVTMVAPDGIELDVHRSLAFGTWGLWLTAEALWGSTVEFTIAGHTLRALDREHRLLHACLHAVLAKNPPRTSVGDVALLLGHPGLDHDRFAAAVERWELEAVIARAIALVEASAGAVPQVPTVRRFADRTPSARDRRAIAAYTTPGAGHVAKVVASLPFAPTWRDRALLLFASLVPGRSFLRSRGGILQWWRRGTRALTRRWRRQ